MRRMTITVDADETGGHEVDLTATPADDGYVADADDNESALGQPLTISVQRDNLGHPFVTNVYGDNGIDGPDARVLAVSLTINTTNNPQD